LIENPPGDERKLIPWGISFHTERFWCKAGVGTGSLKPKSAGFSRLFRLDQYMPPFRARLFSASRILQGNSQNRGIINKIRMDVCGLLFANLRIST
jgi:hypothetical protein